MSNSLSRGFRAQLTTTMDSVMKRAMFEIMNMFENTLHDHQMELARKGEEIAQLKVKLQKVEVKLTDRECGPDQREDKNETQMNESQRELENVNASGQTSDVPEIDFEVPDDWCAPLGCETVTKKDEDACPSIRLRQLYIPLWQIPVIKKEVDNCDIDSHKQKKGGRRSKRNRATGATDTQATEEMAQRISALKESDKSIPERSTQMCDQATPRQPVRNDMQKLLQEIQQECTDVTGRPKGLRRGRNSTGKEQVKTQKNTNVTAIECIEQEAVEHVSEKMHCKVCMKAFDTQFGLSVHVRSHRRCKGCKKEFSFPSALTSHKRFCAKLKKRLAKEAQATDPRKPQPDDKAKPPAPSKRWVIIRKEKPASSSSLSESSIQKNGPTKKHSCSLCNKKFDLRYRLKEHMRLHTGEMPYPCSMCPMKFRLSQSLRKHVARTHKGQVDSSMINTGLSWTVPLEVIEDQEDLTFPSTDTSREINRNELKRKRTPGRKPDPRWQTMGTRCANGFMCLLCQKFVRNKYFLIKHFSTHTRAKPLKCDRGTAKFHSHGQLSMHKGTCSNPMIQCEKCEKKFPSQTTLDKHVYEYHKNWPHICNFCGKGFVLNGRFRNHMQCHM